MITYTKVIHSCAIKQVVTLTQLYSSLRNASEADTLNFLSFYSRRAESRTVEGIAGSNKLLRYCNVSLPMFRHLLFVADETETGYDG